MHERRGGQLSSEERREYERSARDMGLDVAIKDKGAVILPDPTPLKSFVSVSGQINRDTFAGVELEDRIGELKKVVRRLIHR